MIKEIVLTGGPCGGKSSALPIIAERLEERGVKCITAPEIAIQLINGGIDLSNQNDEIQKEMLRLHLSRRKHYKNLASIFNKEQDVVLLYDREAIDQLAYYSSHEAFLDMVQKEGTKFHDLLCSYDAVFHMQSVAVDAPDLYNHSNRWETSFEAIDSDHKTLNAWMAHPHLRVIDNSTGWEEKLERLWKHVEHTVFSENEIERKFLLECVPGMYLPVSSSVEQYYLHNSDTLMQRVTSSFFEGSFTYRFTQKQGKGKTRIENENYITREQYQAHAKRAISTLRKDRYFFVDNGRYWELDHMYPHGEWILETELIDPDEVVKIPDSCVVKAEVTDSPKFHSAALAQQIK